MFSILFQLQTTLTTNDIVINKLSQILSHVRAGGKKSKKEKAKKDKSGKAPEERVSLLINLSILIIFFVKAKLFLLVYFLISL